MNNKVTIYGKHIEKRRFPRLFVRDFLKLYCVCENSNMQEMELLDVSQEGSSFKVPYNPSKPLSWDRKKIMVRFYFNGDTFFSLTFDVANMRPYVEDGKRFHIIGCTISDPDTSYEIYLKFLDLLTVFFENAQRDTGNMKISYL